MNIYSGQLFELIAASPVISSSVKNKLKECSENPSFFDGLVLSPNISMILVSSLINAELKYFKRNLDNFSAIGTAELSFSCYDEFLENFLTSIIQYNNSTELSKTLLDKYIFSDSLQVWCRSQIKEHTYSDGFSVEERLYKIVSSVKDVSLYSNELKQYMNSWADTYHLSPDRHHLLKPLEPILKDKNVLELGCGCGGISRYLGEISHRLIAVEGSLNRSRIAAERCRDLSNVDVVTDLIQDLDFEGDFDIVTLIGVLEYSQIYIENEDPVRHILEKVHKYLKPNGILIVAIENQLGLKYFAGAPEDHGVGIMAGINDIYNSQEPITFGKYELESHFKSVGFRQIDTYLTFPDYKLPTLILHPGYIKSADRYDFSDLVSGTAIIDKQQILNPTFSLEAALGLIERNGLLSDLANSHLFVCHKQVPVLESRPSTLASYYSPNRSLNTRQYLEFIAQEDEISVNRTKFLDGINPSTKTEEFVFGKLYSLSINKIIQREGWDEAELVGWFNIWLNVLKARRLHTDLTREKSQTFSYLPPEYLDALPRNMIYKHSDEFTFIDLEWEYSGPVPFELVAFRGIVVTLGAITSVAKPRNESFSSRVSLSKYLINELGIGTDFIELKKAFREINSYLGTNFSTGNLSEDSSLEQLINLPDFIVRGAKKAEEVRLAEVSVYWAGDGESFSENKTVKKTYHPSSRNLLIELSLPEKRIAALRLDISNQVGFLIVDECRLISNDNTEIWNLNIKERNFTNVDQMHFVTMEEGGQVGIRSFGSDPKFDLILSDIDPSKFLEGTKFVIKMECFS